MKPHHVLIPVMILMTVAALYKYSDNQRIEAAHQERVASHKQLVVRYEKFVALTDREICLVQVKDERICK